MEASSNTAATDDAITPQPATGTETAAGFSRRRFLQSGTAVTAATAATAAGALPAAAAAPPAAAPHAALSFTAATNGAATLAPSGDRLVAEVQNVLWSIPRQGGTATELTSAGLEPTRPQFSPDGSQLVVCAYRGGGFHLWTLRPDGSGLRQRTDGPWDDRGPAWSPDGTRIAFASERAGDPVRGGPYRIWVLDLRTGQLARVTGRSGQDGPHQDAHWEDFDPTWSADGSRLLFVRATVTAGEEGPMPDARTVASVPADGDGPVRSEYTDPGKAGEVQLMTPAVSASGRLALLRTAAAPAAACTLLVDGEPVRVDGDVQPVPPRWTTHRQQQGKHSAAGERLLLTVGGQFSLLDPRSPAGAEKVPFTAELPVQRPQYPVKRYDLQPDGPRPVRGVHLPALSPDGRQVAFGALNALWVTGTSLGSRPRRLVRTEATRYLFGPSWTPDGKALLYSADGDEPDGLLAVRRRELASGNETVLATGGRVFPALSPDGSRLACLDMTGRLLVRDLPDGRERVLAEAMGSGGLPGRPSWSPDGRHLALCDRNQLNQRFREGYNLIRVVDTDTGKDRLYAAAPHLSIADRYDSGPVWSPDGRWMALIAESALYLLPVREDGTPNGAPHRLTREAADHPSWSGDGRTLLYLSSGALRRTNIHPDGTTGTTRTVPVQLHHRRPRSGDTVVHAGQLWDGTGQSAHEDMDITVRDGRITAVTPHRAARHTGRTVDASQQTVLPGLWDCHTHPWQSMYGGRLTATMLAFGITTSVSFGGFSYEQARLREALSDGSLTGPRLLTTGELLDGSRVAYSMGRAHRTRAGLRRSLDRGRALDWDFVKTYVRAPGWLMAEAARFAHRDLRVRSGSHLCTPGLQAGQDLTTHLQATQRLEFGHATTATGHVEQDVEQIYTADVARFHLIATPFTAAPLLGSAPQLAQDPRVTRMLPPWDLEVVRQHAGKPPTEDELATVDRETAVYRRILAAGGMVALGTDTPLVPAGLHLHLALRALHRSGLSAADTLRTATVLPARVFGAEADLGTVEAGRLADLTVVDGDPFTDFSTLVRTSSVLRGGLPVTQRELVSAFPEPANGTSGTKDAPHEEGQGSRQGQGEQHGPAGAVPDGHWRAASRLLRRGSCCDAGV